MTVGSKVITCKGLFFNGDDLSERLGTVIDTSSYILVELDDYHYNPIKCFRSEVSLIEDQYLDDDQLQFDWAGHL